MRNENKRRILAGVIAASLVLQGSAMNLAAFAEDADTTAPSETADTTAAATTESTEATSPTEAVVETALAATTDTISLANPTQIPEELQQGKLVNIKGVLTSAESELTAVSVIIYDQAMVRVTGGAAQPKAKTYDLSRLDDFVTFDKLVPGKYIYRVIASNAANSNQIVQESVFTVVASGTSTTTTPVVNDVLTVSGVTEVPDTIKKGTALNIKGTVTSASSDITYLTCGVYNSEGKFVTGKTIAPKTKSYDLQRLDAYVAFDKLDAGTYTFAVIATNAANNNYALVNKTFKVEAEDASSTTTTTPVTEDKITGTGITQIPDTLKKGTPVSVRGTVTSAVSNITQVTVSVTDAEGGGWMTGKTVDINAKSYNIANLDQYVLFNKLPDGVYNYNVLVTNAANKQFAVYTKKFTVGTGAASTTTTDQPSASEDKLTITGGTNVPDTLAVGKALNVVGTVTSASTNMTALTVGVYSMDGKFVTGRTINPKAKTYNLKNLDAYVEFNKLAAGEYVYAVIASNGANTNYALVNKKFTVGSGTASNTADKLTITNGTEVPANLAVGKALSINGTVTSASSNITALTCGVYDAAGNFKTGKTIAPNAKTYNLHNLDAYVEFNKLPAGSYVYAVIATNAANTNYALVNKSFTVGNASNTNNNTGNTSDALTITGGTTIPDNIAVGKCVSIRGTVTSASSNMTALTCGVYDANGKFVTGKTINPNAKSYDLKKLDAYVAFNTLPAGSYTYAVIATNAANNNYSLVTKKFTVGSGTSTAVTSDNITISGGTTVPSTVAKGKGVIVRGTVSSASSNLTSVTVGVYNASGSMVTGKTANPNAKTYNVSALDSAVRFDQLAAGTYTYRVIATNSANSGYTVVNQTFTVK